MYKIQITFSLLILLLASSLQLLAQDEGEQAKIEDAMSAAPLYIAQDATILDWEVDTDGNFVVLREGTNGWSCLPSNPKPMCLDEVFMDWLYGLLSEDDFSTSSPGFAYMLQGDLALSNIDPFATEAAEDYWETSDPYMRVLLPEEANLSGVDSDIENLLFIMYPDTVYEYLMVPIEYTAPPENSKNIPAEIIRISAVNAFILAENEGALILDARYTSRYQISHAVGAMWLETSDVDFRVDELPKDQVMISYCD